jgi:predicted permease
MDQCRQLFVDLRYGLRTLRKSPAFSLVAILILSLGIGANTAIFTLLKAVMLQSLPIKDPGQVVLFFDGVESGVYSGGSFPANIFSYPFWEYLRDHNNSFQSLSAFRQSSDRLTMQLVGSSNSPQREQVKGHLISGSYFQVLGVNAILGRVLTPVDDKPAALPAAVISYYFWRDRFNLDRSTIGKVVDLNGTMFTIVGITPKGFFGERVENPPDLWLPLTWQPQILRRESWLWKHDIYWLNLIGRLSPGVPIENAEAAINMQLHQFFADRVTAQISPDILRQIQHAHVNLRPGARGISSMRALYSRPLHVLMAVVVFVLLIACANIATLMLARSSLREPEFVVRLALGASRSRLVRQLLSESILLSLFGGATGVAFAWFSIRILVPLIGLSSVLILRPDALILSFTLSISILTGILVGLIPALRFSRLELRGASLGSLDMGSRLLKPTHGLVVAQVALSFILCVGAGLLTHSLLDLEHQSLGFESEDLLIVKTSPRLAGFKAEELVQLYRQLQDQVGALPGVLSVSIASDSPFSGSTSSSDISIEGNPAAVKKTEVFSLGVGPQFFETLRIPLLRGRLISPEDTPPTPPVAVVNESFVREYLQNQNPLGRYLSLGEPFNPPGAQIIGVVGDCKYFNMREQPKPMVFFSAWQSGGGEAYVGEIIMRTSNNTSVTAAELRRVISQLDTRLPILEITTVHDQAFRSLHQETVITSLSSFFALLALLLACVGLYGTMAYSVARRTNEIGIRKALGAQAPQILLLVLRQALTLIVIGVVIGVAGAVAVTRIIASMLYGITTTDSLTFVGVSLLVVLVGLAASYIPARQAMYLEPMVALRHE